MSGVMHDSPIHMIYMILAQRLEVKVRVIVPSIEMP